MKNKKYRPFKLIIGLWALQILAICCIVFPFGRFANHDLYWYTMIVGAVLMLPFSILVCTFYFKVQEDRITIRHGLFSLSKENRSVKLKTRTILISDIERIELSERNTINITVKNEAIYMFPISGYFGTAKIKSLFWDLSKQINSNNKT